MRPKLLAFVKNHDSLKALREYAMIQAMPDSIVIEGNIENACEKILEGARSPEYLVVELTGKDHKTAFAQLDKLANCCEPDTKVIITGDIDELSFYKELISLGVSEYLLNPVKTAQIERVLEKKAEAAKDDAKLTERSKEDCKVISVIGTRGGAGSSSIALNLAQIYSSRSYPTVVVDFDPSFGVIPLLVDAEPNRGLIEALEKPERVDSLFLDRVTTKVNDNLFVIGAEKSLHDITHVNDKAPQVLIDLLRAKFAYVIVDIPRVEHYSHYILQHSEAVIVTELSIPGLRDTMRIYDLINDNLGNKKITVIANKTGLNKKFETPLKDFESGLGRKVDIEFPFEQDIYGFNNSGQALIERTKESRFTKAMNELAARFAPEGLIEVAKAKRPGIFDKLKKK